MRAVLSALAVTTRSLSGEKKALFTPSVCPTSTATTVPVAASHTRAVLSADAVSRLAAAAGQPLADDRCAELVPLFGAVRESSARLRALDLGDREPLGPGAPFRG